MQANIGIDIESFINAINQGFVDHIKKTVKKVSGLAKAKISELIKRELSESSTIKDLISGKLRHEFGLTVVRATNATNYIINHMADNIEVTTSVTPKGAVVTVDLLPINEEFISSIIGGSFKSYRGTVNWADWLITKGTQVVIATHSIYDATPQKGRSGGTLLMREGGIFRVEPEHAGTMEDNFITRAINPYGEEILKIVFDEIARK